MGQHGKNYGRANESSHIFRWTRGQQSQGGGDAVKAWDKDMPFSQNRRKKTDGPSRTIRDPDGEN